MQQDGNLLIKNAQLLGESGITDLNIIAGKYSGSSVEHPRNIQTIDANGRLCVPGFIEPHVHLDKSFSIDYLSQNETGSLEEAVGLLTSTQKTREPLSPEMTIEKAALMALSSGVTQIRSHVDIDPNVGLSAFERLLKIKKKLESVIDIQIVAFPQQGLIKKNGTKKLLTEALEAGADVVGGIPGFEANITDSRKHVEAMFEIAISLNRDIDMHIDESDSASSKTLELLCDATLQNNYQGRVTASHACALSAYDDRYAGKIIDMVVAAEIGVIVNPATNLMLQGRSSTYPKVRGLTRVDELTQKGVIVAFGQDNIQDMFYPFGQMDPLEIAFLLAHGAHMNKPADPDLLLKMATFNGAKIIGTANYGFNEGDNADLVILNALSAHEAVCARPDRAYVVKSGRVVVETEKRSVKFKYL